MHAGQFDRHEDHVLLPWWRKLSFAVGQFGITMGENLVQSFAMTFYPVILKLDPFLVGVALFLPRFWDAIIDPMMGRISDNTRSRWGRRRPYLLYGAPLFGLGTFLMFAPPAALSERGLYIYIFLVPFFYYTAYSVVTVPYTALGLELSTDYHERTRVQTWRSVCLYSAGFLTPWAWRLTQLDVFPNERVGAMWVAGIFGFVLAIPVLTAFLGTREERGLKGGEGLSFWQGLAIAFHNRHFVVFGIAFALLVLGIFCGFGLGQFINIYYVYGGLDNKAASKLIALGGMLFAPMSIIGSVVWGWFGTRVGKKTGLMIAVSAIACVAPCTWIFFNPSYPYLALMNNVLMGFTFGALNVYPQAMVADLCDLDELHSGCRREGTYGGVLSFLVTVGMSSNMLISGGLLNLAGYDENATIQAPHTITALRSLIIIVPVFTMVVVFVLLTFYPLSEKRVREMRAVLEARRVAAAPQPAGITASDI